MELYDARSVKRKRSTKAQLALVDEAIVEAARTENPVTLRGVYYRLVCAGVVDKTEAAYKQVGRRLVELRRSGAVPYNWITDGTRLIRKDDSWSSVDQMLTDAAASYRRALWHDQRAEVMIFSEKDAISGVVYPITNHWDVPLGVLRGYASETFVYGVAEEIRAAGKPVYVYQLGDHDPSGVDAWRDFQRKVTGFLGGQTWEHTESGSTRTVVQFERLAVTAEQIEEYDLPTRPTKSTDTRARGFTGGSVEVDAIPASILRELVEGAITQHIDQRTLTLTKYVERSERDLLYRLTGLPSD